MCTTGSVDSEGEGLVMCPFCTLRQGEPNRCATTVVVLGHQLAAMRFADAARDRQTKAHAAAFGLGGKERLEDVRRDVGRDPRSGVSYGYFDGTVRAGRAHDQLPAVRHHLGDRFEAVQHEVQQRLLQMYPIATD